MSQKREDYISWADYFMGLAILASHRSKDPNSQVGACVVNEENKIVGVGYNGFPIGCNDNHLPWGRDGDCSLDTKYPYVCHAELNAILNANTTDTRGCTLYVSLFPCNECAKLIIQSGIRKVVYLSDKYHESESCEAARKLFQLAGVLTEAFVPKVERIVIDFNQEAKNVKAQG